MSDSLPIARQSSDAAFTLLAELHDALALTGEYNPGASVGSFVDSAAAFERARQFLHSHQCQPDTARATLPPSL